MHHIADTGAEIATQLCDTQSIKTTLNPKPCKRTDLSMEYRRLISSAVRQMPSSNHVQRRVARTVTALLILVIVSAYRKHMYIKRHGDVGEENALYQQIIGFGNRHGTGKGRFRPIIEVITEPQTIRMHQQNHTTQPQLARRMLLIRK